MSMAWETTTEDVLNVLEQNGVTVYVDMEEGKIEEIHSALDMDAIEKAALYGDDMDDQIKYAYCEIQTQLVELNIL